MEGDVEDAGVYRGGENFQVVEDVVGMNFVQKLWRGVEMKK